MALGWRNIGWRVVAQVNSAIDDLFDDYIALLLPFAKRPVSIVVVLLLQIILVAVCLFFVSNQLEKKELDDK